MKNSLAVMDQRVEHLSSLHAPDADGGVTGARDNVVFIVLQAEDGACVTSQNLHTFQVVPIPDLKHQPYVKLQHCSDTSGSNLLIRVIEIDIKQLPLTSLNYRTRVQNCRYTYR